MLVSVISVISAANHKRRLFAFLLLSMVMLSGPWLLPMMLKTFEKRPPPIAPHDSSPGIGRLPLYFEPNEGQTDPSVYYLARAFGGTAFFTSSEIVLVQEGQARNPLDRLGDPQASSTLKTPALYTVRLRFLGVSPTTPVKAYGQTPGRVSYLRGNDPTQWHVDLPTYGGIVYQGLYPGIDLGYKGTTAELKGTYTLNPGADPTLIRWQYNGAKEVRLDEAGNLLIDIGAGIDRHGGQDVRAVTISEQAPVAWQIIRGQRVQVDIRYTLAADRSIGFLLGTYNQAYPLTIDPILTYSTYLGGNSRDIGNAIRLDAAGNIYVAGETYSANFPTADPYQPTFGGGADAFIVKLQADGSGLVYSTYLGGSNDDIGTGLAVDTQGNVYVSGYTNSTDLPVANAIQSAFGGGEYDAFAAKLYPSGSALVYSTYLGGTLDDRGKGIDADAHGNSYVTGYSESPNFPVANAYQPANAGSHDVFVSKLNSTGSAFIYSTYLGGTSWDNGAAIAIDALGYAYVTGTTQSGDFPVANAYQPAPVSSPDAFLTKLTSNGSALTYSTYLGGGGFDSGFGLAVGVDGSAYVSGQTYSQNFPTLNAYQPAFGGGTTDAYVTRFTPSGASLVYSTYLGGYEAEECYGMTVDQAGNAYITGLTLSPNFPVVNAVQPLFGGGGYDAFVTALSPSGSVALYSTFLGGSNGDGGLAVAADVSGNAYITGGTMSGDFPVVNPYQANNAGNFDGFISRIQPGPMPTSTPTRIGGPPTATPTPVITNSPTPVPTSVCSVYWRVVPSANLEAYHNYFLAVGAVSASDVWAVGYTFETIMGTIQPLVEHWNGSEWGVISAPNIGVLLSVDAIAADDVWAVGYGGILHWNGSAWSIVPHPSGGFSGVDHISANDVWAVGWYNDGSGIRTLTIHWNGSAWSIVPSPNGAGGTNNLSSLAVLSTNDIWAVGYHIDAEQQTLTMHWDGTSWTIVQSPNPDPGAGNHPTLHDVDGVAPDDVWSVGTYQVSGRTRTLTEHWDGTVWSIVPSPDPNPQTSYNELLGVVSVAPNEVWAVGYTGNAQATMIQHWDGSQWGVVSSPNPGPSSDKLYGISKTSSGDIWAVGNQQEVATIHTLVERYYSPCFTPTPIATPTATRTLTPVPTTTLTPIMPTLTPTFTYTAVPPTSIPTSISPSYTPTLVFLTGTSTPADSTPTPPSCVVNFADVPADNTFYAPVHCLACRGIVSGYSDGTFKPDNLVTRGQLSKIVSNGANFKEDPGAQIFQDVAPDNTFYQWINRLTNRGYMGGYTCGGPGEPCVISDRPYFRPGANATRAQTAKIVSNAKGYIESPTQQTFEDVPPAYSFYQWIQRLASHGAMGGYTCGGPGEPCGSENRPYFRPGNNVTRGQSSKIVANTFYPDCSAP